MSVRLIVALAIATISSRASADDSPGPTSVEPAPADDSPGPMSEEPAPTPASAQLDPTVEPAPVEPSPLRVAPVRVAPVMQPPLETQAGTKSENIALAWSALPTVVGVASLVGALVLADANRCTGTVVFYEETGVTDASDYRCTNYDLSIATLAVVGSAALVVGPSLGHVYAGRLWNRGLALRLIGAAGFGAGILVAATDIGWSGCGHLGDVCPGLVASGLLLVGGTGSYVVGTLLEIHDAPKAVRDRNARLQSLALAPIATRHGTVGLSLTGRF